MTNDEIPELTEYNTIIPVYMSVAAVKRLDRILQEPYGMRIHNIVDDVSLSVRIALREYDGVKWWKRLDCFGQS